MPANIVVPEVGESIVEARVARWMKNVGDVVALGDPLVELETDKVNLEVPAPLAGVLSRIDHQAGADVKIGEVLGVIDEAGAAAAPPPSAKPADAAAAAAMATADTEKTRATPTAKKAAEQNEVNLTSVKGTGVAGRVTKKDVEQAAQGSAPATPAPAATSVPAPGRRQRRFHRRSPRRRPRRFARRHPASHQASAARNGSGCRSVAPRSRAALLKHRAPPRCSRRSTKSTCRR